MRSCGVSVSIRSAQPASHLSSGLQTPLQHGDRLLIYTCWRAPPLQRGIHTCTDIQLLRHVHGTGGFSPPRSEVGEPGLGPVLPAHVPGKDRARDGTADRGTRANGSHAGSHPARLQRGSMRAVLPGPASLSVGCRSHGLEPRRDWGLMPSARIGRPDHSGRCSSASRLPQAAVAATRAALFLRKRKGPRNTPGAKKRFQCVLRLA